MKMQYQSSRSTVSALRAIGTLVFLFCFRGASGFVGPSTCKSRQCTVLSMSSGADHDASRRRMFLRTVGLIAGLATTMDSRALAADEATVFLTGKAPKVPGQKPKDKNDVNGTRKDPKFLRSISDCKSRCENSLDSEGRARSKEDCLSECQDICCTTYEQCTFAIVPRI